MKISKEGLHFRMRSAFWKDLLSVFTYRNYPKRIREHHHKNRGVKLFLKQCYLAVIEAKNEER